VPDDRHCTSPAGQCILADQQPWMIWDSQFHNTSGLTIVHMQKGPASRLVHIVGLCQRPCALRSTDITCALSDSGPQILGHPRTTPGSLLPMPNRAHDPELSEGVEIITCTRDLATSYSIATSPLFPARGIAERQTMANVDTCHAQLLGDEALHTRRRAHALGCARPAALMQEPPSYR